MNDKIKHLLATAYKTDSIEKNKWRIENREQRREQRKKELKELMEKEKTMSNNKQSSVDWLQSIELERDLTLADWNKAKAMHKVEVVNAVDGFPIHTRHMNGEEYYNDIFGGNND